MGSPNIYQSGLNLAGTVFASGPTTLQLVGSAYLSGAVQFVDTISGNNANAGNKPELPVADLTTAIANSASQGVILIGAGSAESLSGSLAINVTGLSIFGCGTGSSRPRYTCTGAVDMFAVSGTATWIEGIYFPASTAAATDRIGLAAANCTVKDCYFECGANDTNRALRVHTGANSTRVEGCSFVTTASRPAIGLEVSAAVTDANIVSCTFNGGSYGWSDYSLKVSAAATRMRMMGLTFAHQSDLGVTVTATSYSLFGINMDGTSNILLTA